MSVGDAESLEVCVCFLRKELTRLDINNFLLRDWKTRFLFLCLMNLATVNSGRVKWTKNDISGFTGRILIHDIKLSITKWAECSVLHKAE